MSMKCCATLLVPPMERNLPISSEQVKREAIFFLRLVFLCVSRAIVRFYCLSVCLCVFECVFECVFAPPPSV
jgi:hypothetical protein